MSLEDCLDVKVIVNDKEALEYPAEPQFDGKTGAEITTKYIEVVSGARFSFKTTVSPQYRWGSEDCLTARVYIDGEYAGGGISSRAHHSHLYGSTLAVTCRWVGYGSETKKLTYQFTDLTTRDTADSDEPKHMASKYGKLGTLQVDVSQETQHGSIPRQQSHYEVGEDVVVPEKALKGRSLTVAAKMKATTCVDAPDPIRVERLENSSPHIIRFLYRTRESLQSEMIIPRSPSPKTVEEQSEEDLTREQMRELIRKQREQLAIKQELNLKRERPVSTSVPARPLKTSRNREGNTVYHLDSEDDETAPTAQAEREERPIPLAVKKTAEMVEIIDL